MGFEAFTVPVFDDHLDQESVQDDKNKPGDPEGDVDGEVEEGPVSGDRSPPPGTEDVEQDGNDYQKQDSECDGHTPVLLCRVSSIYSNACSAWREARRLRSTREN